MNVNISNSPRSNFTNIQSYLPFSPPSKTFQIPILSPKTSTHHPNFNSPRAQVIISPQKLQHINCIIHQKQNIGALYIGDSISTLNSHIILDNHIQAILCCNIQAKNNIKHFNLNTPIPTFKFINIQDHQLYSIHQHFNQTYNYIQDNRNKNKNILIQCHGGVSRSATILIAYLMKKYKWNLLKTYHFVKQKRSRIKPNHGFWKQLQYYQQCLQNQSISTSIQKKKTLANTNNTSKSKNKISFIPIQNINNNQLYNTYTIQNQQLFTTRTQKQLIITLKSTDNQNKNNGEKNITQTNQNFNPQINKDKCLSFLNVGKNYNKALTNSYKGINDRYQQIFPKKSQPQQPQPPQTIISTPTNKSPTIKLSLTDTKYTQISPNYTNIKQIQSPTHHHLDHNQDHTQKNKLFFNKQTMQTKSTKDMKYHKIFS